MDKKFLLNNQIRAMQVRVIDENGEQIGVLDISSAINEARNRGMDLIQITDKVEPPICKIMDYGKFTYIQEKKEKEIKKQQITGGHKTVKMNYNTSDHDLLTKAKQVAKFFQKGYKVNIQIYLRGRENAFQDLAKEKLYHFIEILKQTAPLKIEEDVRKKPNGFYAIISKGK
ncbi:MAG TPA: translation initiation factor IF-3 [Candidatus Pacearchaeota archaeon]|nr:translation initiation factor IF-3 [Candidatus Pacearchaeota archaeon]